MRTLLLATLFAAAPALAGPRVVVIQSDTLDAYTEPVPAFIDTLDEPVQVVNLNGRRAEADATMERLRRDPPDAVFALGAKAAWSVAQNLPDTPLVYASVLEPTRYGLSGNQVTGVSATVEPGLFLSQFTGFFPEVGRIGIIRGPSGDSERHQAMVDAADAVGVSLVTVEVTSPREARKALASLSEQVDGLWLQPDRETLDASTFRYFTEESRRRGLPLLVETQNMVAAGALFAVIPDADGVGAQAAEMIRRILAGAAPAILPVESPDKTQVVLSLRAARLAEVDVDPLLLDFVDVVVE